MSNDEEKSVNYLLREFLEEAAVERSKGITLETLHNAVKKVSNDQLLDRQLLIKTLSEFRKDIEEEMKRLDRKHDNKHSEIEGKVDRYGRRIKGLEDKVSELTEAAPNIEKWEPDQREITGSWAFQQIMAEHQERKSDARWLKRKGWEWVMGGIGALVLIVINIIVTLILTHK